MRDLLFAKSSYFVCSRTHILIKSGKEASLKFRLYILFIFSVTRAIGYYTTLWHILRKGKVNLKGLLTPVKYKFKSYFWWLHIIFLWCNLYILHYMNVLNSAINCSTGNPRKICKWFCERNVVLPYSVLGLCMHVCLCCNLTHIALYVNLKPI